jgi:hypothetical protein
VAGLDCVEDLGGFFSGGQAGGGKGFAELSEAGCHQSVASGGDQWGEDFGVYGLQPGLAE